MEAATFLLLGIGVFGALLYLLAFVTRLNFFALESESRISSLENYADDIRSDLDSAVGAMSFEIDSLRKRCEDLENR